MCWKTDFHTEIDLVTVVDPGFPRRELGRKLHENKRNWAERGHQEVS